MEEKQQTPPRQTRSKKIAAIAIVAVLVIGGATAAFMLLNKSPKQKYFLAEKNSMDFIGEQFEKRYDPEMKWAEETRNKPTKAGYEVSAQVDGGAGAPPELQMVNNSSLKFNTETDYQKKIAKTDMTVNFNGLEIGGLKFGLTAHELTAKLPFVNDTLLIKDKDLPKLLAELDDSTDTSDMKIDFSEFFEGGLSEEDQEYFKKEYLDMIYDELPEDAFEAVDEKVKIDGNSVSTEKVKMHLTEKQTKDIIVKVLDKAKNDKILRSIIENQLSMQSLGMQATDPLASADFSKEYKESLENAKQEIKDASIPNGISSTIWVADDMIVKRDLALKAGPDKDSLVQFFVKGTQNLGDAKQTFNYSFKVKNDFKVNELTAKGDFSFKDNKAKDTAEFVAEGNKMNYEGNESIKDGKRTFERVFSVTEKDGSPIGLDWSGTANYKKASMDSDHTFKLNAPDMGNEKIEFYIKKDAKAVKSIEKPSKKNVKDLGSMSIQEIEDYFQNDVLPAIGGQFGF